MDDGNNDQTRFSSLILYLFIPRYTVNFYGIIISLSSVRPARLCRVGHGPWCGGLCWLTIKPINILDTQDLDILDHVRKGKIQPSVSGGDKIYRNTIHQQLISAAHSPAVEFLDTFHRKYLQFSCTPINHTLMVGERCKNGTSNHHSDHLNIFNQNSFIVRWKNGNNM